MPHQVSYQELPRIPLEQATFGEVLARVSYRLVQLHYRRHDLPVGRELDIYDQLFEQLSAGGFPQIAAWLHSAQVETLRRGFTLASYRTLIVYRLRKAQHNPPMVEI